MKKLVILCTVGLLVLLAPLSCCQQAPLTTPTTPPTTPTTPTAPLTTPTTPPTTPTPTPPEPEVEELLVLRMDGWVNRSQYWIEGTVKNIGNVPLYDVEFKVAFFDNDNNLITEISAPLNPSTIEVWDTAYCGVKFQQKLDLIKTYRYRFALPSGEEISVR